MKKYRTLLFVPAKEKMLSKIESFNSKAYILDLEDSIEEESKSEALNILDEFLKMHPHMEDAFVRVNRKYMGKELKRLNKYNVGFMIPKFEGFQEISYEEKRILKEHEMIALIETPLGVSNIEGILRESIVDGIAFGGEDYTALTNMENTEKNLFYIKSRLVMYAKAYKKEVFDTPSLLLEIDNIFKKAVRNSMEMGFDGKMAINPKQIDFINDTYRKYDFEEMKKIIGQFEKSGDAVIKIAGKIYEKMHIDRMKRILKENGEI